MDDALRERINVVYAYMKLGMENDAHSELDTFPAELTENEAVLRARLGVMAEFKRWDDQARLAESLVDRFPENPNWWVVWANSLANTKDSRSACEILSEAAIVHPCNELIAYNLAAHSIQLGLIDDATKWIAIAIKLNGECLIWAQEDPDFKYAISHIETPQI